MTASSPWADALQAAAIVAIAPHALGGACLRAAPGPARTRWLDQLTRIMADRPLRRLPVSVSEGRLIGELDLVATLAAKRPRLAAGLLAETHRGILVAAMAERLSPAAVAHITATLDSGDVRIERDGFSGTRPAAIGVVALDEGLAPEEGTSPSLRERLAIWLDLDGMAIGPDATAYEPQQIAAARERFVDVRADDDALRALCATALALGAFSLRAPLLALSVARAAAALAGRNLVTEADLALACRLVIAPRATCLPAVEATEEEQAQKPEDQPDTQDAASQQAAGSAMEDRVLAAATAAIPADVLARLAAGGGKSPDAGRSGATQRGYARGRPVGTRAGTPRHGARLDLVATLRAAAPWQPLRRAQNPLWAGRGRAIIRPDDLRITRFKQRTGTTTIFVVDASGSAALQRLAEAKGAVELLLADCYVRRDQVALIAFRRTVAELLLPPTRSLARAKRCLAALPGGGGTPLAAALESAVQLGAALKARGRAVRIVVLTDGRANVARDGTTGRAAGEADAAAAAKLVRISGLPSLLVDTAPRPQPPARAVAAAMGAGYLPLPHADAGRLAHAVRAGAPS